MDIDDIDRYLSRFEYWGSREPTLETLKQLQLSHVKAIPFENLNRHLTREIIVDDLSVLKKKVFDEKRGGYCFEINQIFSHLLKSLGFEVSCHLARVLWEKPDDRPTGLTHLLLIVHIDDRDWLVDVGAGPIGCPVPLDINCPDAIESGYGQHRILQTSPHHYLHQLLNAHGEWKDSYVFNTCLQSNVQDYVVGSYYTSTHPSSFFSYTIMVAIFNEYSERCVLFDKEFTRRNSGGIVEKYIVESREEYARLLRDVFHLQLDNLTALKVPETDWDFSSL